MTFKLLLALTSFLVLTACGGGGSSSGGGAPTTANRIAIDENNAEAVAGSLEAVVVEDRPDAGGITALAKSAEAPSAEASLRSLSERIFTQLLDTSLEGLPSVSDGVAAREINIPFDCFVSGTSNITGRVADNSGNLLSQGDFFVITDNNCDDGDGFVSNGTIRFTINSFNGSIDSEIYQMSGTLEATNSSITDQDGTTAFTGDMNFSFSSSDGINFTNAVSGASLAVSINGEITTLSNYQLTETYNDTDYSFTVSGVISGGTLNGSVQYETLVALEGLDGQNPDSGVINVEGNNSSMLIRAIGGGDVRLEIDSNGDGSIDEIIDTSWSAL